MDIKKRLGNRAQFKEKQKKKKKGKINGHVWAYMDGFLLSRTM